MKLLPMEHVQRLIYFVRGQKVMLDNDLAKLYQVTTFNLNKAVLRNRDRFPHDFMFQLTQEEYKSLIFQIGISNKGRGGRRHLPYVFTQEGVAMLSGVLHSPRAIKVNIAVMRAFVELRELLSSHKELAQKIEKLEQKYDTQFKVVFDAIRELIKPPKMPSLPRVKGFSNIQTQNADH